MIPTYVSDNMLVLAPHKGGWIRCVVATASGDMARVVNELHKVDRWIHVDNLRTVQGT